MSEFDREIRVVARCVELARRSRPLRRKYGIGWLGVLLFGLNVAALLRDLIDAWRARQEVAHEYGLPRNEAYALLRDDPRFDNDLLAVLDAAEAHPA